MLIFVMPGFHLRRTFNLWGQTLVMWPINTKNVLYFWGGGVTSCESGGGRSWAVLEEASPLMKPLDLVVYIPLTTVKGFSE